MLRLDWIHWRNRFREMGWALPRNFRPCLGCQSFSREAICAPCLKAMEPMKRGCKRCGNPHVHGDASSCSWCNRLKVLPDYLATPWVYRDKGRDLYHLVKYQGYWRLLEKLLQDTATAWQPFEEWQKPVLVPIPESLKRKWHRNFNPAHQIAKILARPQGAPVEALLKIRNFQPPMVGLDYEARRKNARNRFKARIKRRPSSVILVDDVLTTGATLEAATMALKKLGVKKVGWFALFRTV